MGATATSMTFAGRVLFLTEDAAQLDAQLAGGALDPGPDLARWPALLDNISTDEITPGWVCYYYDKTLGQYCLVGLRGGRVGPGVIHEGAFSVLVSGVSKGCGSSRETAPYSELAAGVKLVVARSLEKIYRQNAQNIGLLTSMDLTLVPRILRGEPIPMAEFVVGLDPLSAAIVEHGGLFAYNCARLAGRAAPPPTLTAPRPMTLCEKILARHVVVDARGDAVGVVAVRPGDAFFARADVRFSHEYVTPMAEALFVHGFGEDAVVSDPASVHAFRDHLTLLDRVMSPAHRAMGLDAQARRLATVQEDFARRWGITLHGEVERDGRVVGSDAICHNKMIEDIALPGQLVVGTDSHTCMAGALGCFAFGVGATDMANAWATRDVRVTVPETVRVVLAGALRPGVCAKDVMLHLLSQPYFRSANAEQAIGKVLEFSGEGVFAFAIDERATLTNMAVEAGGFTGIVEADDAVIDYLVERRGLDAAVLRRFTERSDPDAEYSSTIEVDLSRVPNMIATPGDPRNGVPLDSLPGEVAIDIAYGGSCTGGKRADMDMYAWVLRDALERGQRVAPGVQLFLQFGSQNVRRYAEERGYVDLFERAGATVVDPSCGACIRAGPGVSDRESHVTVSAQNRNYPGRSGPGKVYLASPFVVAASAIAGYLRAPAAR